MLYNLFEFKVWGVEQDLLSYVGQLVLSSVSIEGWIIALMYVASLMVLGRLCDSIPTREKISKWFDDL